MSEFWVQVVDVVIVVLFGVIAVLLGNALVTGVFRYLQRTDTELGTTLLPPEPTILRGGTWIGMLERTAVYAGVVAGWKEALAIALVVKGLARYPELASPDSDGAERFIIGTFLSVLFAVACAGLALWLISLTGAR